MKIAILTVILFSALAAQSPWDKIIPCTIEKYWPEVDSAKKEQIRSTRVIYRVGMDYEVSDSTLFETLREVHTDQFDTLGNKILSVNKNYLFPGANDSSIFQYDRRGNIVSVLGYDSLGKLRQSEYHIFDKNGKLVESKYLDGGGTLCHAIYRQRDSSGNQIERINWYRDFSEYIDTTVSVYNEAGNIMHSQSLNRNNYSDYRNGHDGNLLHCVEVYPPDTSTDDYYYSDTGRMELELSSSKSNTINSIGIGYYDSTGHVRHSTSMNFRNKTLQDVVYRQDSTGATEKIEQYDSTNALQWVRVTRRNRQNNPLDDVSYNPPGQIHDQDICLYDDMGNIIRQQEYHFTKHHVIYWTYKYFHQ